MTSLLLLQSLGSSFNFTGLPCPWWEGMWPKGLKEPVAGELGGTWGLHTVQWHGGSAASVVHPGGLCSMQLGVMQPPATQKLESSE